VLAILQDLCTVDGIAEGVLPPGVQQPAAQMPLGTCQSGGQCGAAQMCDLSEGRQACTCAAATGRDSCSALGACRLTPARVCEACVQAMQLLPSLVADAGSADAVASQFSAFCATSGRSSVACAGAAAAVASSFAGNLGRRPGALCRALGKCPAALNASVAPVNATQDAVGPSQPLDLCSTNGTAGGPAVAGVLAGTSLPPNGCLQDSDCSTDGHACSMASTQRVCWCSGASGADTCRRVGSCQWTPCPRCSSCVDTLHTRLTSGVSDAANSSAVAQQFKAVCSDRGVAPAMCTAVESYIAAGRGNVGRRAGALCSMLGELQGRAPCLGARRDGARSAICIRRRTRT
jgi:hypothetical protein